jgi:chromatin structure-remodeling complex subunit RSC1/2
VHPPSLFLPPLYSIVFAGHFADHPLEDIIEKIACQFTARHIRGRPRPPYWYPGWPLYVCDSRYNDRERVFVRIKNWNSCVPEEVRKSDEFMPIYLFERTVFPRRFGSPFIGKGAVKGPGGIGNSVERVEGEFVEGGGTGRKRPRRTAGGDGPSKGLYVGPGGIQGGGGVGGGAMAGAGNPVGVHTYPHQPSHHHYQQLQMHHHPRAPAEDRSIVNAAGGMAVLGGHVHIEKLPSETGTFFPLALEGSNIHTYIQQNTLTATQRRTKSYGSPRPR